MTTPLNDYYEQFARAHPYDLDPDWQHEGACRGSDQNLWFSARGENSAITEAKRICNTCPIKQKCLDYALYWNEQYGIWGGTTVRERRRIPKPIQPGYQIRRYREINHGTHAGYMQHRTRNSTPCPACMHARNEYQNERNRKRNQNPSDTTTPTTNLA
jgi:hypothetical protein